MSNYMHMLGKMSLKKKISNSLSSKQIVICSNARGTSDGLLHIYIDKIICMHVASYGLFQFFQGDGWLIEFYVMNLCINPCKPYVLTVLKV